MSDTTQRGPIHDLDAGLYRAVIRDGVPMVERESSGAAVKQILVPCSLELVAELSGDWSRPVQWRIEDGEFVFRTVRS